MRRRRSRSNPETNLLGPVFTVTAKLVLSLMLVITLAELGAGLALAPAAPAEMPAYRPEDVARLYETNDYRLYQEAMVETWRAAETTYVPFVESIMAPFTGRHVTIGRDGVRDGRPQADIPRVFVFGGSTTFGIGVPAAETLPAFLEAALRVAGKEVQVVNYGTIGHFSTPERILLERLLAEGVKPDVAVFVDGLGDFEHCRFPERGFSSDDLAEGSRLPAREPLGAELAARSSVVRLVRTLLGGGQGGGQGGGRAAVAAGCTDDPAVEKAARRLDANRRMIAGIAANLDFKAVFVQQPVPTYHYDNAKRPVVLKAQALAAAGPAGKGAVRLAELQAAGALWSQDVLWLAELEPAEGNAYIDAVHYSPRFNKAIADQVARHILEAGWLP